MKKLIKTNSKKGFTLLEVMLAVAVMAIGSTMIMQGFIATMNCSRNSKVYSRVGASHYAELISNISENSQLSAKDRNLTGGSGTTINFGSTFDTGIYLWRLTNGTGAAEDTINVSGANAYAQALEDSLASSTIDNRAAFFYIPTGPNGETECIAGHSGEYAYCYYAGGSNSSWATPAFRCIHEMDEYKDPSSAFYHDDNHRYCFQYEE